MSFAQNTAGAGGVGGPSDLAILDSLAEVVQVAGGGIPEPI